MKHLICPETPIHRYKPDAFQGVESNQQVQSAYQNRDIRTIWQRGLDGLKNPFVGLVLGFVLTVALLMFPVIAMAAITFIIWQTYWISKIGEQDACPFKLPAQSGLLDFHEKNPGSGKPMKAKGIFFLGNEYTTGKEMWFSNSDCRQHCLMLGTTGAGKTENLIGFCSNAMTWSSGFLFCDGKGDVSLYGKIYALCRQFGREDDFLVLNFAAPSKRTGELSSNTMNPFTSGSPDNLTQLLSSLMDSSGGSNAMWEGRANVMLAAVMRSLCWLRDHGIVDMSVDLIRTYMNLNKIVDLGYAAKFEKMRESDPVIRKSVQAYLKSLPAFNEEKAKRAAGKEVVEDEDQQGEDTAKQHGFLEMQFTKILGSLTDTYGNVFNTSYGDIDMRDVVLSRRILVCMLPLLQKSSSEVSNLGKIIAGSLKNMAGACLGDKVEGTWHGIIENRMTNAPSPFIAILDEVGYYTVDGMDMLAAQARSLGFMMVYGAQDINSMMRGGSKEEKVAKSIIANTNIKIGMRLEDQGATAELFQKRGGKATVAQSSGYKMNDIDNTQYFDNQQVSFQQKDRIDFVDLANQTEGEMHVLAGSKISRGKAWYADPESSLDKEQIILRPNHFIPIARPDPEKQEQFEQNNEPKALKKAILEGSIDTSKDDFDEDLSELRKHYNKLVEVTDDKDKSIEGAMILPLIQKDRVAEGNCMKIVGVEPPVEDDNMVSKIDENEDEIDMGGVSVNSGGESNTAPKTSLQNEDDDHKIGIEGKVVNAINGNNKSYKLSEAELQSEKMFDGDKEDAEEQKKRIASLEANNNNPPSPEKILKSIIYFQNKDKPSDN